jgi:hypothetical protein
LLNKSSCLAAALGVTKFINRRDVILAALFVLLKSDLVAQLSVARIVYLRTINLVTAKAGA